MNLSRITAGPLAGLLACCAPQGTLGQVGAAPDPLAEAASLLVAADEARGPAERAPMIAGLDSLGVAAVPDSGEDPLADWRREYRPAAGDVFRGRTLGPAYRRAQLAAGQQLVIEQIFNAGERAEMVAQTRTGRTVEVAVANAQSQKICEERLSPHARCRWLPIFTERFKITLTNRGTVPANVYLVFD